MEQTKKPEYKQLVARFIHKLLQCYEQGLTAGQRIAVGQGQVKDGREMVLRISVPTHKEHRAHAARVLPRHSPHTRFQKTTRDPLVYLVPSGHMTSQTAPRTVMEVTVHRGKS